MRSTHDHEDRVRYWLTDAEGGGQPILHHGEQHVKKIYSTVAIDKRGHALKPVRGYNFTGEDTNTRVPWLLKNELFF